MDKKSGRNDRKEIYNVNLMSLMQKTEGDPSAASVK